MDDLERIEQGLDRDSDECPDWARHDIVYLIAEVRRLRGESRRTEEVNEQSLMAAGVVGGN